jgi:hypothetical protein
VAKSEPQALSVGALAKRWGLSPEQVISLIRSGELRALVLPKASRYQQKVVIPLTAVLEFEQRRSGTGVADRGTEGEG